MSAQPTPDRRDDLRLMLLNGGAPDPDHANELLDDYRDEVLAENAAARDCLSRAVLFALNWHGTPAELHAGINEILTAGSVDEQAYDGELAMLRGLVRTLRVVVRPDELDVAEVRRLLHQHASDDAAARTEGGAADV